MVSLNRRPTTVKTHEGGSTDRITAYQTLRRSVMSCLLFEGEFYEDGASHSKRLEEAALKVPVDSLANLAIEVRTEGNLRHVPLLLLSILSDRSRGDSLVADTIEKVIQRPDELCELLAIHANRKGVGPDKLKTVMTHGMKNGLARAFLKFNEYSLAKYNRDHAIKLRDVLFLCHAKPRDEEQKGLFKRLVDGTMKTPDTWEVELSAGADKKSTFERLIKEGKLGYLALLRNLRNMVDAGCNPKIVREAILARKGGAERVLPFRYIAAARYAPMYEPEIDRSLIESISHGVKLSGTTCVLVDVSGSMDHKLSQRSDLTRADAAAALASVINGDKRVFSFSSKLVEVPPRNGMAGVESILKSQGHSSTNLVEALKVVNATVEYDRLIVITDEQHNSSTRIPAPTGRGYMINVASYQNGIGYGSNWTHLDGFSENVIKFIYELENFK